MVAVCNPPIKMPPPLARFCETDPVLPMLLETVEFVMFVESLPDPVPAEWMPPPPRVAVLPVTTELFSVN